ncbi:MAG: hypothetical protein JO328_06435 [Hyphomicrobiales bacterium]|nr:hypothetical protein [Hyphomicrobiales bacterium]MBV9426765.1 hypothetical protein [Bradyrhizobiaceae bacterium]
MALMIGSSYHRFYTACIPALPRPKAAPVLQQGNAPAGSLLRELPRRLSSGGTAFKINANPSVVRGCQGNMDELIRLIAVGH